MAINDGWTKQAKVEGPNGEITFSFRVPTGADLAQLYKDHANADNMIHPTKPVCQFMNKHLVSWSLTEEVTLDNVCRQNMLDLVAVLGYLVNPLNGYDEKN